MTKIATCVPRQHNNRADKLEWLRQALSASVGVDLFLLPQEYFGGHVSMPDDMHIEKSWLINEIGQLSQQHKIAIGVGAAVKDQGGATEDYFYFDKSGTLQGWHRKYALPSYDDVRANGAGQLWPETSYAKRTTPILLSDCNLNIGTVFCWEVYSLTLFAAYSFAGCNLIVHPIKFAPRGWPKLDERNGKRSVVDFGVINKGRDTWKNRLLAASEQECLCPIAISCNSWALGKNYFALTGHVDEILQTTDLIELPSTADAEVIHTFEINPLVYTGLDHHHSAGAYKEHVGDLTAFHKLDSFTMATKVRRLEAQFIGGTTRLDCVLKANTLNRQKRSSFKRARKQLGTDI